MANKKQLEIKEKPEYQPDREKLEPETHHHGFMLPGHLDFIECRHFSRDHGFPFRP